MLSKVTLLLCFCLAVALSKPAEDSNKGLESLQKDAKTALSTLSAHCTAGSDRLLLAAQTTALYRSTNCSLSVVAKAVEDIYVYSLEYAAEAYKVVARIGLHFTGCSLDLIPVQVIKCVFDGIMMLPAEIESLMKVTFQFVLNILSVVPPLVSDIESCLSNSTENFQLELQDLVHKARVCQASL